MLSTAHVIIGAAAGLVAPNVPAAFIAGIVSHHIMDIVPHWDISSLYTPKNRPKGDDYPPRDFILATIDVLAAIAIVVWLLQLPLLPDEARRMSWGAAGALVPDLVHHLPYLNRYTRHWPVVGHWYRFHEVFHTTVNRKNWWVGVLCTVGFMAVAWWSITSTIHL